MSAAASSIRFDVLDLVIGLPAPGLRGRGGGALSGSELSHLAQWSACLRLEVIGCWGLATYIGTELLPDSEKEC